MLSRQGRFRPFLPKKLLNRIIGKENPIRTRCSNTFLYLLKKLSEIKLNFLVNIKTP